MTSDLEKKIDALINEVLVRETTKMGREGQIWVNHALASGLSKKLTNELIGLFETELAQAVKERGQKYLEEHESSTEPWEVYTGAELKWIIRELLNKLAQSEEEK